MINKKIISFTLFCSILSSVLFAQAETFSAGGVTVSVEKITECGMEKLPGLQVWFTAGVKSGFGVCYNRINYAAMMMKRDKVKEMDLGEDFSYTSSDKKTVLTSYLIKEGDYKLKLVLKTADQKKPVTKTLGLPFEITPFEKRKPKDLQIVKKLFKKDEIDQYKFEDLTGTPWRVRVKTMTCTMKKTPCLQFDITVDRQNTKIHVTADDVKAAKKGVITEKTIDSKEWGPGPQKVKVTTSGKKVKIAIWTKTAGIPCEREYDLPK